PYASTRAIANTQSFIAHTQKSKDRRVMNRPPAGPALPMGLQKWLGNHQLGVPVDLAPILASRYSAAHAEPGCQSGRARRRKCTGSSQPQCSGAASMPEATPGRIFPAGLSLTSEYSVREAQARHYAGLVLCTHSSA